MSALPQFTPEWWVESGATPCRCGCGRPAESRGVSRHCGKRMAMGLQPDVRKPTNHPSIATFLDKWAGRTK